MMHRNEEAFPSPSEFDPKRWISQPADIMRVREKCLVPFSRGSRMCIGQTLAMCELYVTLATVLRRFESLKALNVGPLTYVDFFNIYHADDSQKLRVTDGERSD